MKQIKTSLLDPTAVPEYKPRPAYTLREVMGILRVSRGTVYRLLNDGELKSKKVGGRRLVPHSEIIRFLEV